MGEKRNFLSDWHVVCLRRVNDVPDDWFDKYFGAGQDLVLKRMRLYVCPCLVEDAC